MIMKRRFVSMKDLAIYLDISEHTLKSWVYSGRIPFKKIGRLIKFDLEIINGILEKEELSKSCFH